MKKDFSKLSEIFVVYLCKSKRDLPFPGYNSPHYEIFIGHELTDGKPNIVHRYIRMKVAYPDIAAGFILSRNLVRSLSEKLEEEQKKEKFGNIFVKEFTMDPVFELSQAIRLKLNTIKEA
jgi:hypothetical protein